MRSRPVVVVLAVTAFVVIACSGGDDAGRDGSTIASPGTTVATSDATSDATSVEAAAATEPTDAAPPVGPDTTFAVVEVAETGVPGLDSDDSFCAAWSRFGGTWQVIQVAANFAPDPTIVPALEVVAAPVVQRAYDAMFAAWPDQLADERPTVADGFFGPLERRSEVALEALVAAGAGPADLAAIGSAWEAALAARAPDDPVVTPELSDDLWELVDAATADFDARLVGFVDDPSMRITVETPSTDAYLATACPDQGALTGAEVGGG